MVRRTTKLNVGGIPVEVLTDEEMREVAEEDGMVVGCMPVSYGATSISGSTKEICEKCKQEVWMSPATKASKPDKAIICCMECVLKEVKKEGSPERIAATKKQMKEVKND
jgi:hypothetical protein